VNDLVVAYRARTAADGVSLGVRRVFQRLRLTPAPTWAITTRRLLETGTWQGWLILVVVVTAIVVAVVLLGNGVL
jgi:uncharacterized membrane protein YhaH (DUF805 family)